MYYAKKVYKNNIFHGCIRDPETVKKDFKKDFSEMIPKHFSCNGKNRFFVTFIKNDTTVFYELPIDYNFNGGVNNVF